MKIDYDVTEEGIVKYTPVNNIVVKSEIVLPKEIFVECYKKWIKKQEVSDADSD